MCIKISTILLKYFLIYII